MEDNKIVHSAPKKRKTIVIIASVIVVLALGGTAGALYFTGFFTPKEIKKNDTTQDTSKQAPVSEKVQKAVTQSSAQVAQGNTQAAVDTLDAAITSSGTNTEKADLYNQKAIILAQSDPTSAIDAAKKAAELQPNLMNISYLAELYDRAGNKPEALKYYKQSIELYDKSTFGENGPENDRAYYENKVKEMGG